ncbi:rhodanese-related sulfurtransferase [Agrobacterium tumefaciens]|uniref:rhodanese-related sulfurtransferase n=1 Tax=Agrobacterium tumefaciens TaxID=358 RepID=UPI0021D36DE4|nr:rhodanese-related sulfurtransferase [Agrobacterium tumefaciens]NTZ63880.1 rhodanese-related sulfurtransferase [Agrobacterium tumefaciens]UXT00230.1 rhodanese-related sulfurtransferase [Agrobacterium tumefaciens]UXT52929.1 rhodanese-related sulfurtransferase [Agrobacterium tumefaciens]
MPNHSVHQTAAHAQEAAIPGYFVDQVRAALLERREIVLADVREEEPFAQGHPLWAANFPLGRLELDAWDRIPRRDTTIVLYGRDGDIDLTPLAAAKLTALGYTQVHLLDGGLQGWRDAGGELFIDVNVPSKAFGELVEAKRHTPLLDAEKVKALLDDADDVVIVDARRFDEYQTMNIPGSISVPGAELVLRVRELAPNPDTKIIVNCAGRTRSIIGTQSLINAGIPNEVVGLRNGTIGWTLAGQTLQHGADRSFLPVSEASRVEARKAARRVADQAGVLHLTADAIMNIEASDRTLYRFDVRTLEEYTAGHRPGFLHVPGGQLVQETDHYAPVRGARIILSDDDGVRADMTASWLAQMGWDVFVLQPETGATATIAGARQPNVPTSAPVETITPQQLSALLADRESSVAVLDVTASANYVRRHIPGAWFVLRSQLADALEQVGDARRFVVTCGSSLLARFVAGDLKTLTSLPVHVLEGGTAAWLDAGLPVESGETRLASPRIDRYRRPYEGTNAPVAAMQAYLDWEYGLVDQLDRDGTHLFKVI